VTTSGVAGASTSTIAIKGLLLCAVQRMLAWLSQMLVAPPNEAGIMKNVGVFFLARDAVERLAVSPRAGFSPHHLTLLRPFLDAAREKIFAAASTAARASLIRNGRLTEYGKESAPCKRRAAAQGFNLNQI
jgi:hypothetical protein